MNADCEVRMAQSVRKPSASVEGFFYSKYLFYFSNTKTNFKYLGFFAIAMISSVCFSVTHVTSKTVDDSCTLTTYDAQAFIVADLHGGDNPLMIVKYDLELATGYIEDNPIKQPQTDAKSERMEKRYRAGINDERSHIKLTYLKGKPTTRFLSHAMRVC